MGFPSTFCQLFASASSLKEHTLARARNSFAELRASREEGGHPCLLGALQRLPYPRHMPFVVGGLESLQVSCSYCLFTSLAQSVTGGKRLGVSEPKRMNVWTGRVMDKSLQDTLLPPWCQALGIGAEGKAAGCTWLCWQEGPFDQLVLTWAPSVRLAAVSEERKSIAFCSSHLPPPHERLMSCLDLGGHKAVSKFTLIFNSAAEPPAALRKQGRPQLRWESLLAGL